MRSPRGVGIRSLTSLSSVTCHSDRVNHVVYHSPVHEFRRENASPSADKKEKLRSSWTSVVIASTVTTSPTFFSLLMIEEGRCGLSIRTTVDMATVVVFARSVCVGELEFGGGRVSVVCCGVRVSLGEYGGPSTAKVGRWGLGGGSGDRLASVDRYKGHSRCREPQPSHGQR